MKLRGLRIPGYRIDKTGKLVKSKSRQSVSQRIRERRSKRVKPAPTQRQTP